MNTDSVLLLAAEAEDFKKSMLGKYLIARAEADILNAMTAMETADPFNANNIMRLQNDIKRSHDFIRWIEEAVTAGELAYQSLREV